MGRYFFLSYARGDDADQERVVQLFTELSTEIRALTGDDHDQPVGFQDIGSLRAGDTWPDELIRELCTAATFVPLLSPRYIRSQFCGKEWTVFARRVHAYHSQRGRPSPSIIPVRWIETSVPPVLGDIHRDDPSFSKLYQTHGLRHLMKMGHKQEADAFVEALARRVLHVARAFPLPPIDRRQWPDFHAVSSVFGGPEDQPTAPAGDPPPAATPAPVPARSEEPTTSGREPSVVRPILQLDTWDQLD